MNSRRESYTRISHLKLQDVEFTMLCKDRKYGSEGKPNIRLAIDD